MVYWLDSEGKVKEDMVVFFYVLVAVCAALVVVCIIFSKINSGFWSGIVSIAIACLLQLWSMPADFETTWEPIPALEYWGWAALILAAVSLYCGLTRRVRVKYPRRRQTSWRDYWSIRL